MAARPIQPGDIVRISIQDQNYHGVIQSIDTEGIHVPPYNIVAQGDNWQVQGYQLPHTVIFIPGDGPPIYAVYPRVGPRKIIMLLKPRSHEVTYTPFGLEFLNLDANKLPPYALATHIAHNDRFVILPYIKGRSEAEVERLIAENLPETHPIVDINAGEIYTGVYGNIAPVGRSLESVLPCQNHRHLVLTQIPRGSLMYQVTAMASEADVFNGSKPGTMLLGKNGDYFIESTLGFEDILSDIRKCGRVYYLLGVKRDNMEHMAHAMALVINPEQGLLEVFDPQGITLNTRHVYFWASQLIEFLKGSGIELQRRITADEPFCPQLVSSFAPEFRREQQCLVWTYWYLWLRVNNPDVSGNAIRRYMAQLNPAEAFDRVRRIATLAFNS